MTKELEDLKMCDSITSTPFGDFTKNTSTVNTIFGAIKVFQINEVE